jgi:hypothetical protein
LLAGCPDQISRSVDSFTSPSRWPVFWQQARALPNWSKYIDVAGA